MTSGRPSASAHPSLTQALGLEDLGWMEQPMADTKNHWEEIITG